MDLISTHILGTPGYRLGFPWVGSCRTLLAGHQLHHRLLWILQQLGDQRQHSYTIDRGRGVPTVCAGNVSQVGRGLGDEFTRVLLCRICAGPYTVLHLWE